MPDLLQKNRCGPCPRDTVGSKAPLSQSCSTSHVIKCSTAETRRAPAVLMLAQGCLQKPEVFIQHTLLDTSQGVNETAGFSFQLPCALFGFFCFYALIWKAGNGIPHCAYGLREEDGPGDNIGKVFS